MNREFWRNKKVLVTGHTGFKGAWLFLWLHSMGARVSGLSLPPPTTPSLYELANLNSLGEHTFCDIRSYGEVALKVREFKPDVIFNLAAQSLVRKGYERPLETFSTNVMGTANLLEAIKACPNVRAAVFATTDKVYRNKEWIWPYRENEELGGIDPYSASKAASELVISSYREAFFEDMAGRVASGRAGNVVGGGDWADHRLLPDALRAWNSGQTLVIRRPKAVRPWQHVLEPLSGYLTLAEALFESRKLHGAYNFGPDIGRLYSVQEVIELAREWYGGGRVSYDVTNEGPHESGLLILDNSLARKDLSLTAVWGVEEAIKRTVLWHRAKESGANMRDRCLEEIAEYESQI